MSMVSLVERSQKEAGKAAGGKQAMTPGEDTQPPPTLHLGHKHMEKLGLKKMPAVGTKLHFHAVAHVGSTSEDQDSMAGSKKPRRSMTLHIHQMEIGADGPDNDVAQEEQSKAGAKAEMDKALAKGAGSESKKGGKKD
jgi:hypothetical protein